MLHHMLFNPTDPYTILLIVLFVCLLISFRRLMTFRRSSHSTILINEVYQKDLLANRKGTFSILSYNIAGLPQMISQAPSTRRSGIKLIGEKISLYDIVHVQEDFSYNKELYQYDNKHPYRSKSKARLPLADGLNTLSNYPFHNIYREAWRNATGSDRLAAKGFTFTQIEIAPDIFVDFYNVHANSGDFPRAAAARRLNFIQLADYIQKNSKGNALIVMGDFNAHYSFSLDSMHHFLEETQLKDVWVEHFLAGVHPLADPNFIPNDKLVLTSDLESLDKILYRESEQLKLVLSDYKIEDSYFRDPEGFALSDHQAVSARLSWEYNA